MTNTIAFSLIVLVLAAFALDHYVLHWGLALATARRALDLIDWVAVWR